MCERSGQGRLRVRLADADVLAGRRSEYHRSRAEGYRGDAAALFALGDSYERGDGVVHDMAMAASYMQLAAERGWAAAQYRLGLVRAVGLGGFRRTSPRATSG